MQRCSIAADPAHLSETFDPWRQTHHQQVLRDRAVVAHDVPPYAIVAGNPARVVKRRFSDDIIAELEAIAWWDWPVEKITENGHLIVSADIDALKQRSGAA